MSQMPKVLKNSSNMHQIFSAIKISLILGDWKRKFRALGGFHALLSHLVPTLFYLHVY